MGQQILDPKIGRWDLRAAATWTGAAIVLACGMWLSVRGGTAGFHSRAPAAAVSTELTEELGWIDRRLAGEGAVEGTTDPECAGRIASLHWDRAARLAQHEYYRQFGTSWTDDREQEYGVFRAHYLRRDSSGDVAATLAAAQRALELAPPGPKRSRALWFLSLAASATGSRDEEIGALVELTRYKPRQAWVWRRLGQAYQARGDQGRQELAEEQSWRVGSGHAPSPFICRAIRHTPYAKPPPRPEGTGQA